MLINDSRAPGGIGILPLRHDAYDKEYDLDLRAGIVAVTITGRNDSGEYGLGQWKYDRETVGDVTQAHFWRNASRPIGGWSWCWPATIFSGGTGATPTQGSSRPSVASVDRRGNLGETAGAQHGGGGAAAVGGGGQPPPPKGAGQAGPGVLQLGIGAGSGIGRGSGLPQFSYGGDSSLSALSGIQGVGTGSSFATFSFGGSSSAESLSGVQGVGTGSGFAQFVFPPEPGSRAWREQIQQQQHAKAGLKSGDPAQAPGAGQLQAGGQPPGGGSAPGGQPVGAGGVAPEAERKLNQDTKGKGKGSCGMLPLGAYQMLPCIDRAYAPDIRFQPITPEIPTDSSGRPLWKPPVGSFGIALAATNEEKQIDYFMPTDSRLYAVNEAGDPTMGSLVCDLTSDFRVDDERTQHLQSLLRVIKKPLGGPNALAVQLGLSGCGDTSGGWFYDGDIIARGSRTNGGPFDVGGKNDIHRIGQDADGHPINMLHIGTNALFRKNAVQDGPIRFEDVYHEGDNYSNYVECHLAWTGADWAIWTSSPLTEVPARTTTPTPATRKTYPAFRGILESPTLTPIPSVDPRKVTPTLKNNMVGFVGSLTNLAASGVLAWPQDQTPGAPNDAGDTRPPVASVDKAKKERPVTGQMAAFGGQGGLVSSGGCPPPSRTGAEGDPYVYTQRPGDNAKFPCGTGPGGWCILPPEVSLADKDDGYVPPNITTSTTYFGVGPGAYFYAALPELANGAVKSGYSWGVDTVTGDLMFRYHPVNTVPTNAIRFTSSGNLSWYSGTANRGIFDHANTADRTYTFPDVSGTIPLGTGSANQVAYWDSTNALSGDDGLTYDATLDLVTIVGLTGRRLDLVSSHTTTTPQLLLSQSSTGDAALQFSADGTTWMAGIDNSVAGNPLVIAASATLGTSDVLGLATSGTITTSGKFALGADVHTPDVILERDGANILALKNGTNAQQLRVYGTTTGPRYAGLRHDGTSAIIEGVGTGSSLILRGAPATGDAIYFQTATTNRLILTDLQLYPATDAAYALGSSSFRYSSGFFSASLSIGTNPATSGAIRLQNATGVLWRNAANTENIGWRVTSGDVISTDGGSVYPSGINLWTAASTGISIASTGATTIHQRANVGTATDAAAQGAFAAGLTGAQRIYYDVSNSTLATYTVGGSLANAIRTEAGTETVFNEPGLNVAHRFEGDTLTHHVFVKGLSTAENVAFFATAEPAWQSMDRGFFVGNAETEPTGDPSGGLFLWSSSGRLRLRGDGISFAGNYRFSHGTSALATTATEGFFHLQSCAGTPTGTPASIPSGQIPIVIDSTNKKLYGYIAGLWTDLSPGGGVGGSGTAFKIPKWTAGTTIGNSALETNSADTELFFAQAAATSGNVTAWRITAGAHTGLTAGAEVTDVWYNLSRTVQRATGAVTTQRAFRVGNPTYSFVGASTITNAYTFYVDGAPVAGTNATITRPWAAGIGGNTEIAGHLTVGTTGRSANTLGAGSAIDLWATTYGTFTLASTRADADGVILGSIGVWYDTQATSHDHVVSIDVFSDGATANQRGGRIAFSVKPDAATTLRELLNLRASEVVINDTGALVGFRVEGDTLTHLLFTEPAATAENVALFAPAAPNWQSMDRGLYIGDVETEPTGNPSDGLFLYSLAGGLKARASDGGTLTQTSRGRVNIAVVTGSTYGVRVSGTVGALLSSHDAYGLAVEATIEPGSNPQRSGYGIYAAPTLKESTLGLDVAASIAADTPSIVAGGGSWIATCLYAGPAPTNGTNRYSAYVRDSISVGQHETRAVTPNQITSDQNDYTINTGTFFRLRSDALRTITGIAGGRDGRHIILRNAGSHEIRFAHQSSSSSPQNRMIFAAGADYTLPPQGTLVLIYDPEDARWVEM